MSLSYLALLFVVLPTCLICLCLGSRTYRYQIRVLNTLSHLHFMYFETPLLKSKYFPQDVYLKLENTQPSGSFKSRGITHLIAESVKREPDAKFSVFSSSGGNAGLAAAEAAEGLGLPCTVVVPQTTKHRMRQRIGKYGAHVVVEGRIFEEANAHLRNLIEFEKTKGQTSPIYCHAFENELIWEGHSSIVDEIVRQLASYTENPPDAIVLSCGGGGLYIGVMQGLERLGLADKVKVYVVETHGAASFHDSVVAKKQITLDGINTVATSLGSVYVPQTAIDYALKYNSEPILVSDEEALKAASQFGSDHCIVVEPACSATLAALYERKFDANGPVIAIVCGGTSWALQDVAQTVTEES